MQPFWRTKTGKVKEASKWQRPGAHFDRAKADRAVDFIETACRHVKGELAGQLFKTEGWQREIVRGVFGWIRPNGTRLYREVYIEVPRKNGKSSMGAALALYLLFADGEQGAEIYSAAADTDQAAIVFGVAKGMVEQDPDLDSVSESWRRSIVYKSNSYHVLSADAPTKHGKNSHGILFDELHAQPNRELYDVLKTSTGSRRSPLMIMFTTAGFDRNSICWEVHEYAQKVIDGTVNDPAFLPIIYAADENDDWTSEKTWKKANPNYSVSIKADYLRAECEKAKVTPAYENTFKRLHLNLWCVARETLIRLVNGGGIRADQLREGDQIVSYDENTGELVKGVVKNVKSMEPSSIYRITTSRGRIIRTNGDHPFWYRIGRPYAPKYGWLAAKNLIVGSRIGVALGHCRLLPGTRRISAEQARFLGLMCGDGTCNRSPRLTSSDPELIQFFNEFVTDLGDRFAPLPDGVHFDARNSTDTLKRTKTRRFLQSHSMWRVNCRTKRVPRSVFTGGPQAWAAFLSGYLDTDGHVSKESLVWISINRDLLADCQELLATLGIQSSLDDSGRVCRLSILDAISFDLAADLLTPLVARKAQALKLLSGKERRTGITACDRRDFDPVSSVEIEPEEETIGIEIENFHTHITAGLITHNTQQETRWLQMSEWDACATPPVNYDQLRGRRCFGGLDLASTTDIAALSLIFPGDPFVVLPFFWIPEESMHDRVLRDRVPYDVWQREGYIEATPGNSIDYRYIMLRLGRCRADFDFKALAFDRWGSTQITTTLCDEYGFTSDEKEAANFKKPMLWQFGQGFSSMTAPTKELLNYILARKITHGGNPVLRWMANNVVVKQDPAGNIKPDKGKSTEKIDGIVAMIMSLELAIRHSNDKGSVYADREMRFL